MRRVAADLAVAVSAVAAVVWLLRRRIAVVTVTGESMRPALASGDRVLVRRARLGQLRLGQIVVVERPGRDGTWDTPPPAWPATSRVWLVKRVAALPGDVWPREDTPSRLWSPEPPSLTGRSVPPGTFAVLGDNSLGSYDSRSFGYCPADRLLGVMVRAIGSRPPR